MARKLRQVIDLYVAGKVAVLSDGTTPVWVQILNPFEQDTARNEATIARARITMALREFGGDEQAKVRLYYFEDGIDAACRKIVDAKVADAMPKVMEQLRSDPQWEERLQILERGIDDTAKVIEEPERELLTKLVEDYQTEMGRRFGEERDFQNSVFDDMGEEDLWEAYLEWYISRRAAELSLAEYRLHQMLYGARWCEGVFDDETGAWDHKDCAGHTDPIFTDKQQVRSAPEQLIATLMTVVDEVEMTVREAKNSDRQGSSSDSSPLPSEAEESTASTPEEIRVAPPGISSSPSPKRSPSSATAS